jgi:Uma2 family endonuclease
LSEIVVQGKVSIPAWINDLSSFRRWATSDAFPSSGWFSYLNGRFWVDVSMEDFFTHNQVKLAFTGTLWSILKEQSTGRFVPDRMLFTNTAVNLSTEPDGLFFLWATLQSGTLRLISGKEEGHIELEGTPDMTLEIVSKTSERKDAEILRDLYWRAGIREYWLVDARGATPRFDILSHTADGYAPAAAAGGWVYSAVFDRELQVVRECDPLGQPQYFVNVRTKKS